MRPGPVVVWVGVLAGGLAMLHRLGGGDLGSPPADPEAWNGWLSEVGPAAAVAAGLRIAGLGVGWYLVGVTILGLLGRGHAGASRLVGRVSPPFLRVLMGTGGGLTLSLGALAPTSAAPAMAPVLAEQETPTAASEAESAPTATLARIDFDLAPIPPILTEPVAPGPEIWQIAAGDHLWLVASEVLRDARGEPACDQEIARYWQRLIEHNRDRLVVPDDPDLVYPGQVLELPPLPQAPGV